MMALICFLGYDEYFNGNLRKVLIWPLDGAQAVGNPVRLREAFKG